MKKKIEPIDGLTCGVCGGRMYVANIEPDYRTCDCSLKDVWNFFKKGESRKPKNKLAQEQKETTLYKKGECPICQNMYVIDPKTGIAGYTCRYCS